MSDPNAGDPTPPPSYPAAPPAPQYQAPQYQTPQYPQPAYGVPGYAPQPKTNVLAIVSLVSSLVGIFVLPFIGSLVGVITGHMSLNQLKTSGEGGRGLALAGTIIGWIGLAFVVIGVVIVIVIIAAVAASGGFRTTYS